MRNEIGSVKPILVSKDTGDLSTAGNNQDVGTTIGLPYTYVARGGNDSAVWGTLASVRICDPKSLCQLYTCLPELKNRTDISQHMRNNKEVICMGFSGRTALEFRISQHDESLPSFIECHEHYIITGMFLIMFILFIINTCERKSKQKKEIKRFQNKKTLTTPIFFLPFFFSHFFF